MKLKKTLGQNFLTDSFFLEKIVLSSQIQNLDDVIEIGPGDGALTEFILKKSNSLTAIEIDQNIDSMSEIANIYINENNLDDAKRYLNMALEKDPQHKKSNFRLGNLYLKLNEHKKGLKHIKKATGFIRFNNSGFEIIE